MRKFILVTVLAAGVATPACAGVSFPPGSSGGSMVSPGSGIPKSTGSAWGTSYGVSGTGNVALTASPSFTGTVAGANANWTGAVGIGTAAPVGNLEIYSGPITTSVPGVNIQQTWNNASTTFDAPIFANITNTASNSASNLIDLQVGGASQFKVSEIGVLTASGSLSNGRVTISQTNLSSGFSGAGGGGFAAWQFGFGGNSNSAGDDPIVTFNMNSGTRTWTAANVALEEIIKVTPTPLAAAGAMSFTNAAAFSVIPTNAGANATITNDSALYVPTTALTGTVTNSYGLNVAAATGATNNYAAIFTGGAVGIGTAVPLNAAILDARGMITANGIISNGATFTIASGCGTPTSLTGGATTGSFKAGQTACAPVITLPAAPNGWWCQAWDITTNTDTLKMTADTTTSCTLSGTVAASDVIVFNAQAF